MYPGVWRYSVWPELPPYSPETVLQPDQDDKYKIQKIKEGETISKLAQSSIII